MDGRDKPGHDAESVLSGGVQQRGATAEPALQRYAFGPVPPIHIIVKNGHVTLEGVVDTQADKELVYMRANGVPGVFSVTNNLRVESGK